MRNLGHDDTHTDEGIDVAGTREVGDGIEYMTGEQFARIRKRLKLSYNQLGKVLRMNPRTVRRIEEGHPISGPVSVLMEVLSTQRLPALPAPTPPQGGRPKQHAEV